MKPVSSNIEIAFKQIQEEGIELFKKKNKDYGNGFINHGYLGVIIRIQDKINRMISVTQNKIECVSSETLRDTLIDLHNYSAMAIIALDNKHTKKKKLNVFDEFSS